MRLEAGCRGDPRREGPARPLAEPAQVTAGNRNTQIAARPEFGPGSGAKDWKCNGMRCTGEWNYGNAEKCRKCGRLKGL